MTKIELKRVSMEANNLIRHDAKSSQGPSFHVETNNLDYLFKTN